MKSPIFFLLLSVSFPAFAQQLVSTVDNAQGDNSNIKIANSNSLAITNDRRGTIWLDNDGKFKFRSVTGKGFAFRNYANTLDEIIIDGGGNMGIGTTTPRGKLNIDLPMDGSTAAITIGSSNRGDINVPIGRTTGGYNIDFQTWRDVVPVQTGARIRAERINNFSANNALTQTMDLAFYTSTGVDQSALTEKLRIRSDGNVGIGTADPQAKLGVNGLIRAREVKVETGNWPDFVFSPKFILPTLNEVRVYIKKNQHLQGFPSADVVLKDGLSLGEMNRLLTQKVEELTLYLLEKDEHDKKQNQIIDQQNQQIKKLIEMSQLYETRIGILERNNTKLGNKPKYISITQNK